MQQKIHKANAGSIGPLDLYSSHMKRLLILYLSTRHSCIDFGIASKRDSFAAIRCAFLIRCLKKPGQKLQARKSLDVWLARCGFASTHIRYIVLPHYAFKSYCQRFLVDTLRSQNVEPLERAWLASRVRFRIGSPVTFKDEWNHVKICKTQCSWDPASAPPIPKEIPGVVSRVEKNWQVESGSRRQKF